MKKYYLLPLGFLFLLSCATEEPTVVNCTPTSVKISNNSESVYTFSEGKLTNLQSNIGSPDETNSYVYEYSGDQISRITSTEADGTTLEYKATYSGSNLTKLAHLAPGTTNNLFELRYVYNGDKVSTFESWYANTSGTLFQIGHTTYGYDSDGNMTQSEINLDIAALLSIGFFDESPEGYTPATFDINEYVMYPQKTRQ